MDPPQDLSKGLGVVEGNGCRGLAHLEGGPAQRGEPQRLSLGVWLRGREEAGPGLTRLRIPFPGLASWVEVPLCPDEL